MGRYETLNDDTKDLVNCLLPALAEAFKVPQAVDIIPEDIRMRAWDCERRDHIKDETENDPRNWGVQFLKDLMSISRMTSGSLAKFQADLRAKVALHEPKHPWARLSDIKEIKDEYLHPNRPKAPVETASDTSSTDSYLEELHEPEFPKGSRSRKRNHEIYEARVQPSHKRRKYGRLRRDEDGGYLRKEKVKGHSKDRPSAERSTPRSGSANFRRATRTIYSDDEEPYVPASMTPQYHPTPAFSMSPAPGGTPAHTAESEASSNLPIGVQRMHAELEVAEAELKAARAKFQYLAAKEKAEAEAKYGGGNEQRSPYLDP